MDALDFIDKLVNHIHSNGFRVVRRYGLYSRRKNKFSIEIVKLYNFIKQRNILDKSNYKNQSVDKWTLCISNRYHLSTD